MSIPSASASDSVTDGIAPAPIVFTSPRGPIIISSRTLRVLMVTNLVMGSFHAGLLAVTIVLGNLNLSAPIFRTDIEYIEGRNNPSTGLRYELLPTYEQLEDGLPLTWLTAAFFLCSTIAHFGNATIWRRFYEYQLSRGRVPTRWIEYFFSASLMILLVAYAAGVREYTLLISIACLVAATIPYGWVTETLAVPAGPSSWTTPLYHRLVPHVIGYVPQTAAWVAIIVNFYDETDGDTAPAFVHAIIWTELLLFWSFGFVQLVQQCLPPRYYVKGEFAYQFLSLASKGALGGLLIANVIMLDRFEDSYD